MSTDTPDRLRELHEAREAVIADARGVTLDLATDAPHDGLAETCSHPICKLTRSIARLTAAERKAND